MGRPKNSAPQHVEPEDASQESPDDEGGTPVLKLGAPRGKKAASSEPITKAEAIRRALAEGLTKHEDAAPFIKTHFGHDITPGHFAASKSREKPTGEPAQAAPRRGRPPGKAKGVTVKVKRGRKPKATVEDYLATPPASKSTGDGDILETLEALKPLLAQHGAERLKRLVDVLG